MNDPFYILSTLVEKDFKVRYRNMSLGVFWSLVNPLIMMLVLTFVFSSVFPGRREHFWLFVLARIFNLMYELQTIQRPSASLLIGARAR